MRPRETRQIVLNATPACGRFILEIGEPCPIQPTFVKIVNLLFMKDFDPRAKVNCSLGWALAGYAVHDGNNDVIIRLLKRLNPRSREDSDVISEMAKVAIDDSYESLAKLKLLIENGVDVNFKAPHGKTLLMMAAESGRPAHIQFLIQKGADVLAKADNGITAMHLARDPAKADLIRKAIKANPNAGPDVVLEPLPPQQVLDARLLEAVRKGDSAGAITALNQFADPNAKSHISEKNAAMNLSDSPDTSPVLTTAAEKGLTEVVRALLDKGAQVNDS
jgi:ankyrin repeat protein